MTNRPANAPERRPGEALDFVDAGDDLVLFELTFSDARIISELLEAGAAALKYAPGTGGAVDLIGRRHNVRLGRDTARALRLEAERVKDRREWRRTGPKGRKAIEKRRTP